MVKYFVYAPDDSDSAREIYQPLRDNLDSGGVRWRNPQFWEGEIENCEVVYVHEAPEFEALRKAYKQAGKEVRLLETNRGREVEINLTETDALSAKVAARVESNKPFSKAGQSARIANIRKKAPRPEVKK